MQANFCVRDNEVALHVVFIHIHGSISFITIPVVLLLASSKTQLVKLLFLQLCLRTCSVFMKLLHLYISS